MVALWLLHVARVELAPARVGIGGVWSLRGGLVYWQRAVWCTLPIYETHLLTVVVSVLLPYLVTFTVFHDRTHGSTWCGHVMFVYSTAGVTFSLSCRLRG